MFDFTLYPKTLWWHGQKTNNQAFEATIQSQCFCYQWLWQRLCSDRAEPAFVNILSAKFSGFSTPVFSYKKFLLRVLRQSFLLFPQRQTIICPCPSWTADRGKLYSDKQMEDRSSNQTKQVSWQSLPWTTKTTVWSTQECVNISKQSTWKSTCKWLENYMNYWEEGID